VNIKLLELKSLFNSRHFFPSSKAADEESTDIIEAALPFNAARKISQYMKKQL
jgi:hypothetical protein